MKFPFDLRGEDTPTGLRRFGAKGMAFASIAVAAPLLAASAVGAMAGNETLAAPINAVSAAADTFLTGSSPTPVANNNVSALNEDTPTDGPSSTVTATETPSGTATASTTATGTATTTATGTPTGDANDDANDDNGGTPTATPTPSGAAPGGENSGKSASQAAHTNGKGCDDFIFAEGRERGTPGGPIGCDVGNSADHRQNGLHGKNAQTPDDGAGATPTETPTPGTSASGADSGPGNNGNKPAWAGNQGGSGVQGPGNAGGANANGKGRSK